LRRDSADEIFRSVRSISDKPGLMHIKLRAAQRLSYRIGVR
jgi:hypothetical protein